MCADQSEWTDARVCATVSVRTEGKGGEGGNLSVALMEPSCTSASARPSTWSSRLGGQTITTTTAAAAAAAAAARTVA